MMRRITALLFLLALFAPIAAHGGGSAATPAPERMPASYDDLPEIGAAESTPAQDIASVRGALRLSPTACDFESLPDSTQELHDILVDASLDSGSAPFGVALACVEKKLVDLVLMDVQERIDALQRETEEAKTATRAADEAASRLTERIGELNDEITRLDGFLENAETELANAVGYLTEADTKLGSAIEELRAARSVASVGAGYIRSSDSDQANGAAINASVYLPLGLRANAELAWFWGAEPTFHVGIGVSIDI